MANFMLIDPPRKSAQPKQHKETRSNPFRARREAWVDAILEASRATRLVGVGLAWHCSFRINTAERELNLGAVTPRLHR